MTHPRTHRAGCTVEGCGRPHFRRGYCRRHWQRWYRHGDPTALHGASAAVLPAKPLLDLAERHRPWNSTFTESTRRGLIRIRTTGQPLVSLWTVEKVCDEVGVHPCDVYGGEYYDAAEEAA